MPNRLVRPTCSSARRNSGWNTTTNAMMPKLMILLMSHASVRMPNRFATAYASSTAMMPFASCAVRVWRTSEMAS